MTYPGPHKKFQMSKCVCVCVLVVLVLHCCTLAFSSCGEQGLLFIAVPGLLVVLASLVADHGI